MSITKELKSVLKNERKYSSFFEGSEKDLKEVWVVKMLFESMAKNSVCHYKRPLSFKPDPPDCIAEDTKRKIVAFEVSELVDQDTIQKFEKGYAEAKVFTDQELINWIQDRVAEKDTKIFHGGPYTEIILVIFTDEFNIDPKETIPIIKKHIFRKPAQITKAYFMFSYDARVRYYPYVELNF